MQISNQALPQKNAVSKEKKTYRPRETEGWMEDVSAVIDPSNPTFLQVGTNSL